MKTISWSDEQATIAYEAFRCAAERCDVAINTCLSETQNKAVKSRLAELQALRDVLVQMAKDLD